MTARIRSLRQRLGPADRGAEPLETAIMVPVVLLFCGLIAVGGAVALAHLAVQHAAFEAARTASLARTPAEASSQVRQSAEDSLTNAVGVDCTSSTVTVDTLGFSLPVGTEATVTARVACTVSLDILGFDNIVGDRHITAEATSPLDRYRERSS